VTVQPVTGPGRILIVDDQEANVQLLERILQRAGYEELHSTTDPRTVERMVAEVSPDLILLDLNMPPTRCHPRRS